MGKGGNQGEGAAELEAPMPTFRWEEIQKHNLRTDKWLVIDRKVYNITKWSSRHPGGQRVIGHYAGEDATVRAWGLSRHPSPLKEGGRSRGSQDVRQHLQRRVELGGAVPVGRKSVYGAHIPLRILVPWHSWVSLPWGSDFGAPEADPIGGDPCRIYRARSDPCVRSFLRVQPEPGNSPKPGRRDPETLAPPAWKMAALGPAERSERGARCRTPRASPTLRPDKGAGKESSSPAGARSCWNCSLRRSAMAASETPPGSSCSHAF